MDKSWIMMMVEIMSFELTMIIRNVYIVNNPESR